MFSNYAIKKSEFAIHFKNGYFLIISLPTTSSTKASLVEEIRELFVGDSSDFVTVSVFNNPGNIIRREELLEPDALLGLMNEFRNFMGSI